MFGGFQWDLCDGHTSPHVTQPIHIDHLLLVPCFVWDALSTTATCWQPPSVELSGDPGRLRGVRNHVGSNVAWSSLHVSIAKINYVFFAVHGMVPWLGGCT